MDKRRTQRLVSTLFELGFLEQNQVTRKYRPGIAVLGLGYAALASLDVRQVALPFMRELLDQFGQSVNLAMRSNLDVIMVECLRGERYRIGVRVQVGDRLPVHVSSLGRAILSRLSAPELDQVVELLTVEHSTPRAADLRDKLERHLQQARRRGYAVMDQETERGVRSVAAPVSSRDGTVVAAINVAMPTPLMSMEQMVAQVAPAVVRIAALISERLGP